MSRVGVHDYWFVEQFRNGIISITDNYRVYRVCSETIIDYPNKDGYYQIFLYDIWEQRMKTMFSHRLVWMLYNGQYIPEGLIINHADGVKSNNFPSNLELSTYSGNNSHAHTLQLNSSRGELNSRALFTNIEVNELRKQFATTDVSPSELANMNNMSRQQMWQLLKCRAYKSVITPYDEACKNK